MLIPLAVLEKIRSGDIKIAFRKWKRPTVKTGGTLRTRIGVLQIDKVEKTTFAKISERDAKNAGFESRSQLLTELRKREGDLYRIKISYSGDDPRIKLRQKTDLSSIQISEILNKLQRMDARSKNGPWTEKYLTAIEKNPRVLAAEVADKLGLEKKRFKANVRKLKELGLTESQAIGYTLSPRGKLILKSIRNKK